MAYGSIFGDTPNFLDFEEQGPFGSRLRRFDFQGGLPALPRSSAPSIADLLPPQAEPQYPEAPQPFNSVRDLDKESKKQLFMQQLLQFAGAIGGPSDGYMGNRMLAATAANLEGQRAAVEEANRRREEEYLRKRQEAERRAKEAAAAQARAQEEAQVKARLAVGQKAVELAGGEGTDPAFAAQVYGAVRSGDAGTLQKLLDEAPVRRQMRDLYGIDPDDPLGRKAAEERIKSDADIKQKRRELEELGPLKSAAELEEYEQKKQIDRRYPSPQAPTKDNIVFDRERGILVNEDKGTWTKFEDPLPPARDRLDTELEDKAISRAASERKRWNEDWRTNGKPFDFKAAYTAALNEMRAAVEAGRAEETSPLTPHRGNPKPEPGKSIQDPKGAVIGIGGGKPTTVKPPAPPKPEGAGSVAAVEAQIGKKLTKAAKEVVERLVAEGKTTSEIVSMMGGGR